MIFLFKDPEFWWIFQEVTFDSRRATYFFLQFLDPDGRFMGILRATRYLHRYFQLMLSSLLAVPRCTDKLTLAEIAEKQAKYVISGDGHEQINDNGPMGDPHYVCI